MKIKHHIDKFFASVEIFVIVEISKVAKFSLKPGFKSFEIIDQACNSPDELSNW